MTRASTFSGGNYAYLPSALQNAGALTLDLAEEYRLTPSLWMGDPALAGFVAKEFPECSVVSLSELVEKPEEITPRAETWATFFEYSKSPHLLSHKDALIRELQRISFPTAIRPIDCEVLLKQIQVKVLDSILETKPRFFLASQTPHGPLQLATLSIAQFLKIPFLFFQPATALGPYLIAKTALDSRIVGGGLRGSPVLGELRDHLRKISEKSIDRISQGGEYLLKPETSRHDVSLARMFFEQSGKRSLRSWLARQNPRVAERLRILLRGASREDRALGNLQGFFKSWLGQEYLRLPVAQTSKTQFFLFALHMEPERTFTPEGGMDNRSQLDLVLQVREILNNQQQLIVKEHHSQVRKKRGHMGRSGRFYRFVNSLPNTGMVRGSDQTNELIRRATAIFTASGTVGLEAALRGTPVVYFGHPFWAGIPGSVRFEEAESIQGLLELAVPDPVAARKFLLELVEEEVLVGHGTTPDEQYWTSAGIFDDSAPAIHGGLKNFIGRFAKGLPS